jgi:hypothetical protein
MVFMKHALVKRVYANGLRSESGYASAEHMFLPFTYFNLVIAGIVIIRTKLLLGSGTNA